VVNYDAHSFNAGKANVATAATKLDGGRLNLLLKAAKLFARLVISAQQLNGLLVFIA
jgi:hypothetical protein